MQKVSLPFVAALLLIVGVLGFGAGYALTPEYRLSMQEEASMDLGLADRWLDLRYINAMIAHHRGAMLLAEQAQESTREDVKNLAAEILANEPALIEELYEWKKAWYEDERTVQDPLVPQLGDVNDTFDLRFLNALIAHHTAGIKMTQEVRLKSSRSEVLDNADSVESFLNSTLPTLQEWRSSWYSL